MTKVSVVIPYFQRTPGILRRALLSILRQQLLPDMTINVVVVDDGSPVSANSEAEGLSFNAPFTLTLITQENAGVSVARNTALKAIAATADYIAFLDSDDSWREGHLRQGVIALERGYDFYFCDNQREGHHNSCFEECCKYIIPFIRSSNNPHNVVELTAEEISTLILKEFVTQASTVIYRYSAAPALLFNQLFKNAGEDLIFFLQLAGNSKKICFSPEIMVECGTGVNIYFAHLGWDSDRHITQIIDRIRAHLVVKKIIPLSLKNTRWNNAFIAELQRSLVFHTFRKLIKNKGKWPSEINRFAREDKWFPCWFFYYGIQVVIGKCLGLYHSD